jgi:hypothetical protein
VIGIAKLDFKFKMRFGDFWLKVNYYYPPDEAAFWLLAGKSFCMK